MSPEGATDGEITVTESGITVMKEFRADDFPIPAIRFEISSARDEPVSLQLSEDIPEEVPMEIVGFHPDYDSENWTAFQDHHVEYERSIEPDETFETVYGIRIDDPEEAEAFMSEPEIAAVSPDGEGVTLESDEGAAVDETTIDDVDPGEEAVLDDIASPQEHGAVKDMITDEEESSENADAAAEPATGADGGETAVASGSEPDVGLDVDVAEDGASDGEDGSDVPTDDVPDGSDVPTEDDAPDGSDVSNDDVPDEGDVPNDDVAADAAEPASDANAGAEPVTDGSARPAVAGPDALAVGDHDSLAGALADELTSSDVPPADREALRDALDVGTGEGGGGTGGSVDARIQQLQSRVEDIAAYGNAMEEFLNDEGTANQLSEQFQEQVDDLESEIDGLADSVDATAADVDAVSDELSAVDADVETVQTDLGNVRARVDGHDDRLKNVDSAVEDVTEEVQHASQDVDHLREQVDDLESSVENVATVEDEIDDLRDGLERIEDRLEGLHDLQDDLDEVGQEVEEIQRWRNQLGEMFD